MMVILGAPIRVGITNEGGVRTSKDEFMVLCTRKVTEYSNNSLDVSGVWGIEILGEVGDGERYIRTSHDCRIHEATYHLSILGFLSWGKESRRNVW